MQDTFEGLEDDDLEELADKEVDKVLFEITNGAWVWPGGMCSSCVCVCVCAGQLGELGPVATQVPDQQEQGVRVCTVLYNIALR